MVRTYTTIDGDMTDTICRRAYGDESGYVEAVYDANMHLSSYPMKLPAGIVIHLPDVVAPVTTDEIALWGQDPARLQQAVGEGRVFVGEGPPPADLNGSAYVDLLTFEFYVPD